VESQRQGVRATVLGCFLLVAAGLTAQSLIGTWISPEPILLNLKFSLTFSEEEYLIDCTLGQTIGTWRQTPDKIYFTPTKVGINSGDIGKSDTWDYSFTDADSFNMSSGAISVRMTRKK
jgi:hypothetical protein